MTYKDKKALLESYQHSMRSIKGLQREVQEWEGIATSITQKISPVIVHSNENNSKVEMAAIRVAEIQQTINDEILKATSNRIRILSAIDRVPDSRRRELLIMRYVNGMSAHKIAIELGKDDNNIYKMLRTTIKKMEI